MKVPLSWIEEYTEIKLPLKELMWRMTEVGMTCESYSKVNGDIVLDIEVTPNRPDWLSITGVAREVAIIQNTKFVLPELPVISKPKTKLPFKIDFKSNLTGGYSGITISSVNVKPSPVWLQKRLIAIGLRPINNLVDITNYVMFELGVPIHVFDYDKFFSNNLSMELSKGGEVFTSVDGLKYILPEDTLIIKDKDRVVDLCGIKGGQNTEISDSTKNIFIHVPIYSGAYIRKTSRSLKLTSDASYIYERGPSLKLIPDAMKRVVSLVLKLAGGNVSSNAINLSISSKTDNSKTDNIIFDINNVANTLGIDISQENIIDILSGLEFCPIIKNNIITCKIPNHRTDIKIKEDILEEIARIYGYNKFPLTLPESAVTDKVIPYFYDRDFELNIKQIACNLGFYEINTTALCSNDLIIQSQLNVDNHIRIDNPVSLEYEFMRSSLLPNLLLAVKLNKSETGLKLFEYNKTYFPPVNKPQEEYKIAFIINSGNYRSIKAVLDIILAKLGIKDIEIKTYTIKKSLWHPFKAGVIEKQNLELGIIGEINPAVLSNFEIKDVVYCLELNINELYKLMKPVKFNPIPKYPPQIEDITLQINNSIKLDDVIKQIKTSSDVINNVELTDIFENNYTFRIVYLNPTKTLDNNDIIKYKNLIKSSLKKIGVNLN